MSESLQSSCLNPNHQDQPATFICTNSFCKEYKIYCFKCYKDGKHIPHYFETAPIYELPQYFQAKQEDSEQFIDAIQNQLDQVQELFVQLKQGLRQKYQINQTQLNSLSGDRLNQAFIEMIRWNDTKNQLQKAVGNSVSDLQKTFTNSIQSLDLHNLNYFRTLEEIQQMQQAELSQVQQQEEQNQAVHEQNEEVVQQHEEVEHQHSEKVDHEKHEQGVSQQLNDVNNQQHEEVTHQQIITSQPLVEEESQSQKQSEQVIQQKLKFSIEIQNKEQQVTENNHQHSEQQELDQGTKNQENEQY